jgi:hypothetical protein
VAAVDLAEVKAYLGQTGASHSDEAIESALAAERADQAKRCKVVGDDANADLREALLRRVARNLAMRGLPLGVMGDEAGTRLGSKDPEVRRLEAGHAKLVFG